MQLSFVVPTCGRTRELALCIASIHKAASFVPTVKYEILVVFQDVTEYEKDCICVDSHTRKICIAQKGLSIARNTAIREAAGMYLVFLDDDAQVPDTFFGVCARDIIGSPYVAIAGRIYDNTREEWFAPFFAQQTSVRRLTHFGFRQFFGSAHIIHSAVFKQIGCYDEDFGAGAYFKGSEESDLFFRMCDAGITIKYLPSLVFYHPISVEVSPERVYQYAFAVGAVLMKQLVQGGRKMIIYSYLLMSSLIKSSGRLVQVLLNVPSIRKKNRSCHYWQVVCGTINGMRMFMARGHKK